MLPLVAPLGLTLWGPDAPKAQAALPWCSTDCAWGGGQAGDSARCDCGFPLNSTCGEGC